MKETIFSILENKGCRMTPQRRAILQVLIEKGHSLTVAEITASVRRSYPEISMDTVYRNLNVFKDAGILVPIAGVGKEGARFELAPDGHHHHHAVCLRCGKALCLDFCPISAEVLAMLRQKGFDLTGHSVELTGICAACRKGEGRHE